VAVGWSEPFAFFVFVFSFSVKAYIVDFLRMFRLNDGTLHPRKRVFLYPFPLFSLSGVHRVPKTVVVSHAVTPCSLVGG
jgi:hypothetical protein